MEADLADRGEDGEAAEGGGPAERAPFLDAGEALRLGRGVKSETVMEGIGVDVRSREEIRDQSRRALCSWRTHLRR